MRRLLLSLALAVAVGGSVLGAAASLGIPNTTLSAGSAIVASCDTDGTIDVTWPDPRWDAPYAFFDAYTVKFSMLDDACFGKTVDVVLTGPGGGTLMHANPGIVWYTLDGVDDNYFYAYFSHVNAELVEGLHLLIH